VIVPGPLAGPARRRCAPVLPAGAARRCCPPALRAGAARRRCAPVLPAGAEIVPGRQVRKAPGREG